MTVLLTPLFLAMLEQASPAARTLFLDFDGAILGDEASAEVFVLALDGLFTDQPSTEVLEKRTQLLAARFAPPTKRKKNVRLP